MSRALIVVFWLSTVLPNVYADAPPVESQSKIARLIDNLGSRDFHVRDAASHELSRAGVEILPDLQRARKSADPEVRRRLDELIPPLARKLALAPKLISLHMTARPIKDVLAEVTRQTGYKIASWPDEQPSAKDPHVYTFHLDNVPFWQALDQICEAAGLILQQGYGDDTLRVYAQESYVPFACYTGAFRIVATGFNYSRSNQFGQLPRTGGFVQQGPGRDSLLFTTSIAVEPKMPMLRAGQMRILEAVDDEHHSMIATNPAQPNDGFSRRYYYGGSFRSFLHQSQAPLLMVSRTAQSVKKIRGVIPVTIVSEQKQIVVTERLLSSKGKKIKAGGATFQIEDVSEMPGKQYQLRISITDESRNGSEDGSLMQSFQQRLQVQDDKGVSRPMNVMSISQNGNNHMQLTFLLMPVGNVGAPNRLVYLNWETLDHEVEFEFRDLPLP